MELLTEEETEELILAFRSLDLNKKGRLSSKELKQGMRTLGMNPTEDLVQEITNKLDYDGDGTITFREFVTTLITLRKTEETDDLREAFAVFDTEHKGFIESKDIRRCLQALSDVPKTEIDDIIAGARLHGNRAIDFDEFSKLLVPLVGRHVGKETEQSHNKSEHTRSTTAGRSY